MAGPLTVEELRPNFKVHYYLFKMCIFKLPIRINLETGFLTLVRGQRDKIQFRFEMAIIFLNVWRIFVDVLGTVGQWEETQAQKGANNAPYFWEKPLVYFLTLLFPVLITLAVYIFDILVELHVEAWNAATDGLIFIIEGPGKRTGAAKNMGWRLEVWRAAMVPIFAMFIIFPTLLYVWYDDHPYTLVSFVRPEWRAPWVTLFVLSIDLSFHLFFMAILAYYSYFQVLNSFTLNVMKDLDRIKRSTTGYRARR